MNYKKSFLENAAFLIETRKKVLNSCKLVVVYLQQKIQTKLQHLNQHLIQQYLMHLNQQKHKLRNLKTDSLFIHKSL